MRSRPILPPIYSSKLEEINYFNTEIREAAKNKEPVATLSLSFEIEKSPELKKITAWCVVTHYSLIREGIKNLSF